MIHQRIVPGMVIKTNYSDRLHQVIKVIETACICPKYHDELEAGDRAPQSPPHYHLYCIDMKYKSESYFSGYDASGISVWDNDELFLVSASNVQTEIEF